MCHMTRVCDRSALCVYVVSGTEGIISSVLLHPARQKKNSLIVIFCLQNKPRVRLMMFTRFK
jgi:hypothetical protein